MGTEVCAVVPHVSASDGSVIVRTESGVAFAVTAQMAIQMSELLIRSAARARAQQRMNEELPFESVRR